MGSADAVNAQTATSGAAISAAAYDHACPFFHVRITEAGPVIRGAPHYFTGHRLCEKAGAPPEGLFASWSWDGKSIDVQCDRYGFYVLYYAANEREFWISPSIATLLREGAPADLDKSSLSLLVRFRNLIADRTPFRAIRAVPRTGRLRWTEGRLEAKDEIPILRCSAPSSRESVMDDFIDLFRAAIKRRAELHERAIVPLSGGRDSRHIVLELARIGRPPVACYTVDRTEWKSKESEVASMVARQAGILHVIVPGSWPSVQNEIKTALLINFSSYCHSWQLDLVDALAGSSEPLYDGIAGDVLSESRSLTAQRHALFESGRLAELADELLSAGNPAFLADWFRSPDSYEAARELLIEELKLHANAPNPVGSFFFWNRTRRGIAPSLCGVLNQGRTVYAPYLDSALRDYLAALPAAFLLNGRLHTDVIARAYPEYAGVPYFKLEVQPLAAGPRRTFAADLLKLLFRGHGSGLIETSCVIPRLLAAMTLPSYSGADWFYKEIAHTLALASLPVPKPGGK